MAKKITVWNATAGIVKVGKARVILRAGTSMIVNDDEFVQQLIAEKKLVVLGVPVSEPIVEEVDAQQKKKKKSSQAEDVQSSTIDDEVKIDEPSIETSEDSILHNETL